MLRSKQSERMLYEHENGKTEMKTVVLLENVVNSFQIADIKASLENHLYLWVVSRGNESLSPSSYSALCYKW